MLLLPIPEAVIGIVASNTRKVTKIARPRASSDEQTTHSFESSLNLHLDGRFRRVDHVGYLFVAVAVLSQLENLTGTRRNYAERPLNIDGGRRPGGVRRLVGRLGRIEKCFAASISSSVKIVKFEKRRFHGETHETVGLLEVWKTAVDADQGVLDEIFDFRLEAHPLDKVGMQNGAQAGEQLLFGMTIAGMNPVDEIGGEFLGRRHLCLLTFVDPSGQARKPKPLVAPCLLRRVMSAAVLHLQFAAN